MRNIIPLLRYMALCLVVFCGSFSSMRAQLNTEQVTLMGRAALGLDDYVMALRYFNAVIEATPRQANAYFLRAQAKFSLDDYQGAEMDCSTAIDLNPFRAEYYELRGLCRIRRNAYKEAIADYGCVLEENPYNQTALYNKAICHLAVKEYGKVDSATSVILQRWSNFRNAYLVKAQSRLEQKDTLGGLYWIDSLLTITKREPVAWSFKGIYALKKGEYAQADSFLTQAIIYDARQFEHYLLRAQARNALFRFDGAIADYGKVIDFVPEHYVAHYNRGLLRALVGDNNRAIKDFDFVLALEPQNTIARYNRALLREQTGNMRGAIEDYTQIIKQFPAFYAGYIARARCRRRIGDVRGAVNDETVVARVQLDLAFAQKRRQPIRKVVRRSELEMKNYQQLIEEDADTAQLSATLTDALHGKVQNKYTERQLLPAFTIAVQTASTPVYYLVELQQFNVQTKTAEKLVLTRHHHADTLSEEVIERYEHLAHIAQADSLLLRSVLRRQAYDLNGAQQDLAMLKQKDSANILVLWQEALLLTDRAKTIVAEKQAMSPSAKLATLQLEEALAVYDRLLAFSPRNAYAYYNRALVCIALHRQKEAMDDLAQAIKIDRRFAEAYYNRGILAWEAGHIDTAIADFGRAGELGLYQAYNLLKQLHKAK